MRFFFFLFDKRCGSGYNQPTGVIYRPGDGSIWQIYGVMQNTNSKELSALGPCENRPN